MIKIIIIISHWIYDQLVLHKAEHRRGQKSFKGETWYIKLIYYQEAMGNKMNHHHHIVSVMFLSGSPSHSTYPTFRFELSLNVLSHLHWVGKSITGMRIMMAHMLATVVLVLGLSVLICLLLTGWLVSLRQLGNRVLKSRQFGLHDPEAFCKPHLLAFQKLLHLSKYPNHLVLIHARLRRKREQHELK